MSDVVYKFVYNSAGTFDKIILCKKDPGNLPVMG